MSAPVDLMEALKASISRARESRLARCTGLTARWCPVHGDCACPDDSIPELHITATLDDPKCPLHAETSDHATVATGSNSQEIQS